MSLHGLHLTENRRATVVVDATGVPDALKTRDVFFPVLGTWLGLINTRMYTDLFRFPMLLYRPSTSAMTIAIGVVPPRESTLQGKP